MLGRRWLIKITDIFVFGSIRTTITRKTRSSLQVIPCWRLSWKYCISNERTIILHLLYFREDRLPLYKRIFEKYVIVKSLRDRERMLSEEKAKKADKQQEIGVFEGTFILQVLPVLQAAKLKANWIAKNFEQPKTIPGNCQHHFTGQLTLLTKSFTQRVCLSVFYYFI